MTGTGGRPGTRTRTYLMEHQYPLFGSTAHAVSLKSSPPQSSNTMTALTAALQRPGEELLGQRVLRRPSALHQRAQLSICCATQLTWLANSVVKDAKSSPK